MKKKGLVTLYIIIGLVIVILISALVYLNGRKADVIFNDDIVDTSSFSGLRTSAKLYIDDCLEHVSLNAIDKYGLLYSEKDIGNYVDLNLVECLEDFKDFNSAGYEVNYGNPESTVVINENQLFVDLFFPVTISGGSKDIKIDDFQYKFRTTVFVKTPNGILEKGTTLFGEDEDFVLQAQEETKVTNKEGKPVESFSVKVMDKEFDGLNNGVVIGEVAYEGGPDELLFDPPVRVEIRVDKLDLPVGYDPEDPRLGWYDRVSDIWRTYEQCGFKEDSNYYYYCGFVDHFTPVAVVACGASTKGQFHVQMEYVYESPIQPIVTEVGKKHEALTWTTDPTCTDCSYLEKEEMPKAHCLFLDEKEKNPNAEDDSSALSSSKIYNVEYLFTDEETPLDKCGYMMQDWDGDDLPENNLDLDECFETLNEGCRDKIVSTIDITKYIASEDIIKLFGSNTPTNEQIFNFFYDGDGIIDEESVTCTIDVCTIDLNTQVATPNTYGFETVSHSDLTTLEGVTFEEVPKKEDIIEHVGGYGIFKFELNDDGNGCIDDFVKDVNTKPKLLSPVYKEGDQPGGVTCEKGSATDGYNPNAGSTSGLCGGNVIGEFLDKNHVEDIDGNGISCSPGDSCFWQINPKREPGLKINNELQGGLNLVTVIVQNNGGVTGGKEADAYAAGLLEIRGTGIKGLQVEECDATLQERLNYYNGCDGGGVKNFNPFDSTSANLEDARTSAQMVFHCLGIMKLQKYVGLSSSTSLCDLPEYTDEADQWESYTVQKTGNDGEKKTVGAQCVYFEENDMNDGFGRGGICATCTGQQKANIEGKECQICPGKVTPGMDNGCWCGNTKYDGKSEQYCCGGSFNEEGCNLQISPIALKSVGEAALGQGGADQVDLGVALETCGDETCTTEKPICCGIGEIRNENEYTCTDDLTECNEYPNEQFIKKSAYGYCEIAKSTSEDTWPFDTVILGNLRGFLETSDCRCGEILLSESQFSLATNEIFCCNNGNIVDAYGMCGDAEDAFGEEEAVCSTIGMCYKDGASGKYSCIKEGANKETAIDGHVLFNECIEGMSCCVPDSYETDICCQFENGDRKPLYFKDCIDDEGKINPYIAGTDENCNNDHFDVKICCKLDNGNREFMSVEDCQKEEGIKTYHTDKDSCTFKADDDSSASNDRSSDDSSDGHPSGEMSFIGLGKSCEDEMCNWYQPHCCDGVCKEGNSCNDFDLDNSYQCPEYPNALDELFYTQGCWCGDAGFFQLGSTGKKYCCPDGTFKDSCENVEPTCCIHYLNDNPKEYYCSVFDSSSSKYVDIKEGDCISHSSDYESGKKYVFEEGEKCNGGKYCGGLPSEKSSDSDYAYCIEGQSSDGTFPKLDVARSGKIFPVGSAVCYDNFVYECYSHNKWKGTTRCSECYDDLRGNAECIDYCEGDSTKVLSPSLTGHLGMANYEVNCKVCGEDKAAVYTCQSKDNWGDDACKKGCFESYDCDASCFEHIDMSKFSDIDDINPSDIGCLGTIPSTLENWAPISPSLGVNKLYKNECRTCGSGSKDINLYYCTNHQWDDYMCDGKCELENPEDICSGKCRDGNGP